METKNDRPSLPATDPRPYAAYRLLSLVPRTSAALEPEQVFRLWRAHAQTHPYVPLYTFAYL